MYIIAVSYNNLRQIYLNKKYVAEMFDKNNEALDWKDWVRLKMKFKNIFILKIKNRNLHANFDKNQPVRVANTSLSKANLKNNHQGNCNYETVKQPGRKTRLHLLLLKLKL